MSRQILFVAVLVGLPSIAHAEFVQVEQLLAPVIDEIVKEIDQRTVVVASRNVGPPVYWRPHEAFGVELTAALRSAGVDAIRYATDPRIASLGDGSSHFGVKEARLVNRADRQLLAATTLVMNRKPSVMLALFDSERGRRIWYRKLDVPAKTLEVEANLPALSQKVRKFCLESFDSCVGNGECAELATQALKSSRATRTGVYTWGRELDDREPVLPGDIVQLELARLKTSDFSRSFPHHTAVVEEVRPTEIVVLQQNVGPKGKIVQRDRWPTNAARDGSIVVYRPWLGSSPLPPVSPRRRQPPRVVRRGDTIDLLKTLDPRLDSVRGIWFWDDGLKWNRDTYARLQVPLAPPETYTLRLTVQRLFGKDGFGVGLVVDRHQTLLAIDSYGGKVTGLHLLDGKKCKDNETKYGRPVLPLGQEVKLVVQVKPDAIRLQADGQTIVDWTGDASRLSMQEEYSVPREDWLFLTSWNTQCVLTAFTLDPE